MSAPAIKVEVAPVTVHHASKQGTASCGEPAKLENIQPWGENVNCARCIRLLAERSRVKA